ncbi:hypothetical protein C1I98_24700 [Spongiactinospora gelatinilytica]|uniref:Uncharacterized protein n=1 Tax=Spongiactinospora gelatinilytica TaxID=2666298 RepID=A0A2W2GLD3_9ACTN|nr:hypothetical protein [Spongiactinospora gelatinilytica]PZG38110.1 hypothetical protein C1I98_24700 [Spongiactinospora gelatinilytica]
MTPDPQPPPPREEGQPEFREDTIAHLKHCMIQANRQADEYAQLSAEERRVAEGHLRKAATYEETAVRYRMIAGEWLALINYAQSQREAQQRAQGTGPHPVIPPAAIASPSNGDDVDRRQADRLAALVRKAVAAPAEPGQGGRS